MANIKPENLIEEVKKHPALYDQTEEQYRNTDYKDTLWKKIAKELKIEGQEEECKKKWNGIRDSLRRSLHRRKTNSGQASKYKYENILEFLVPHISGRKQNNVPDDDYDGPGYDELQPNPMLDFLEPDISCKFDCAEDAGSKRKHIEPKISKSAKIKTEQHPVDGFLAAIAPSLKALDPYSLIAAKGKIFNIVQDFELQQLKRKGEVPANAYFTSELAQTPSSPSNVTSEED